MSPLRSKSGCDRCRKRRKKCDEHKPICMNCKRWGLVCIFVPATARDNYMLALRQVEHRAPQFDVSCNVVPFSTLYGVCTVFLRSASCNISVRNIDPNGQEARILDMYQELALYKSLRKSSNRMSSATIAAAELDMIMQTLSAYSTWKLLKLGPVNSQRKVEALQKYQCALQAVQSYLKFVSDSRFGVQVLLSVTFLGLIELFEINDLEAAETHLKTVAQLCADSRASIAPSLCRPSLHPLIADCWQLSLMVIGELRQSRYKTYTESAQASDPSGQISKMRSGSMHCMLTDHRVSERSVDRVGDIEVEKRHQSVPHFQLINSGFTTVQAQAWHIVLNHTPAEPLERADRYPCAINQSLHRAERLHVRQLVCPRFPCVQKEMADRAADPDNGAFAYLSRLSSSLIWQPPPRGQQSSVNGSPSSDSNTTGDRDRTGARSNATPTSTSSDSKQQP